MADRIGTLCGRVSAAFGNPSQREDAAEALSGMARELAAAEASIDAVRPYLYHLKDLRELHDQWCSADGTLPEDMREALPDDFKCMICQFIESEDIDEAVAAYDKAKEGTRS